MALVLKQGSTWLYKGINVPLGYAVIDFIAFNKRERVFSFTIEVYARSALAGVPENVMRQHRYDVSGVEFDTWFAPVNLSNKTPYTAAYEYLLQLVDENGTLVWGDWQNG